MASKQLAILNDNLDILFFGKQIDVKKLPYPRKEFYYKKKH